MPDWLTPSCFTNRAKAANKLFSFTRALPILTLVLKATCAERHHIILQHCLCQQSLQYTFPTGIIFEGSVLGYNILLELSNITSPVPVNAVAFGTQNGNEGVWRVSNNQSKKF